MENDLKKLLILLLKSKLFIIFSIVSITLWGLSTYISTLFVTSGFWIILYTLILFLATVVTAIIANMIFNVFAVELPNAKRKIYINKLLYTTYARLPFLISCLFRGLGGTALINTYKDYIDIMEKRKKENIEYIILVDYCNEMIQEIRGILDEIISLISEIKDNEIIDDIHMISTHMSLIERQINGKKDMRTIVSTSKSLCRRAKRIMMFIKQNYDTKVFEVEEKYFGI
jgi:hypothetical protein